jgi:hypothetical protein
MSEDTSGLARLFVAVIPPAAVLDEIAALDGPAAPMPR